MTTLADARAELVAALVADGVAVDVTETPCVRLFSGGVDVAHIGRGQVAASWRVVSIAGGWEDAAADAALSGLLGTVLGALRDLGGWQIGDMTPARLTSVDGSDYLTAECTAARYVDV